MSIKVIGGEFKNRSLLYKLPSNKTKIVRPILARVRKSLFDIITPYIKNSIFLDLYCGTGIVGIEALSRGAQMCVFVDSDEFIINLLKKNIVKFNISEKTKIFCSDVFCFLNFIKQKTDINEFDIIFLGPPYKENFVLKTLELIVKQNILNKNGLIIAQHHFKENTKNIFLKLLREEKYGDTVLSFFNFSS